MKKIIFLHGFFSSGNCPLANTLREELSNETEVLSPDLPLPPIEALENILLLCQQKSPDLIVGNSCGSFYAQIVSKLTDIPALLGNPHFEMHSFLTERKGTQRYKTPRTNNQQEFIIDGKLVEQFAKLEEYQFNGITEHQKKRVWGLFGEADSLANFKSLFEKYYTTTYYFPGNHTPTVDEVKKWYAPLVKQMLQHSFNE